MRRVQVETEGFSSLLRTGGGFRLKHEDLALELVRTGGGFRLKWVIQL